MPVNLVIVGKGLDVLKALLRAGGHEQPSTRDAVDRSTAHCLFGRLPDATFRIGRNIKRERNELYVWQTPMRVDGQPVWMGRVAHLIGQRTQLEQVLFGATIDPDVNEGRNYFLQNIWYSQSLKKIAWLRLGNRSSVDDVQRDFNGAEYFTDGHVVVTWLSGDPISLIETKNAHWDSAPHNN